MTADVLLPPQRYLHFLWGGASMPEGGGREKTNWKTENLPQIDYFSENPSDTKWTRLKCLFCFAFLSPRENGDLWATWSQWRDGKRSLKKNYFLHICIIMNTFPISHTSVSFSLFNLQMYSVLIYNVCVWSILRCSECVPIRPLICSLP